MSDPALPGKDTAALSALILWIQGITIRVAAIEQLTREKLNISDVDWDVALKKAAEATPLPALELDPFSALADFLKRATGPR
jgi:hypothetical protein